MKTLHQFPFWEIEFRSNGRIHDQEQVDNFYADLEELTDLFIFSHGWRNDKEEAKKLYSEFFEKMTEYLNSNDLPEFNKRKFGVLRLYWPAVKFAPIELIPGTEGGIAGAEAEIDDDLIYQALDSLKELFPDDKRSSEIIDQIKERVPFLKNKTLPQAAG